MSFLKKSLGTSFDDISSLPKPVIHTAPLNKSHTSVKYTVNFNTNKDSHEFINKNIVKKRNILKNEKCLKLTPSEIEYIKKLEYKSILTMSELFMVEYYKIQCFCSECTILK